MKKIVGVVLCLLLAVCLFAGCSGGNKIENAVNTMASEDFSFSEKLDVPLSLLNLSEEEVQSISKFTASPITEDVTEYIWEFAEDREIVLQTMNGEVKTVWYRYTDFDLSDDEKQELTTEFAQAVDTLSGKYIQDDITINDVSGASVDQLAQTLVGEDYNCHVTFHEKEDDSSFFIMIFRNSDSYTGLDSLSYCLNSLEF